VENWHENTPRLALPGVLKKRFFFEKKKQKTFGSFTALVKRPLA
jgi:hypothetical protein